VISRPSRSFGRTEAILLLGVLGAYAGLAAVSGRLFGDLYRYLLPNLWLVAASAVWIGKRGFGFHWVRGGRRPFLGLAVAVLMSALVLAMSLLWPNRAARALTPAAFFLVLLVPVSEELFFRGLLLDRLRRRLGSGKAAVVVSAIFGLAHLPQGATAAAVMLALSLLLSALILGTRALSLPVAVHIGWNSLAVIRDLSTGGARWILCAVAISAMTLLAASGLVRTDARSATGGSDVVE
jgi:membrane protease YdiL (CAAX protease family)